MSTPVRQTLEVSSLKVIDNQGIYQIEIQGTGVTDPRNHQSLRSALQALITPESAQQDSPFPALSVALKRHTFSPFPITDTSGNKATITVAYEEGVQNEPASQELRDAIHRLGQDPDAVSKLNALIYAEHIRRV